MTGNAQAFPVGALRAVISYVFFAVHREKMLNFVENCANV